MRRFAVVGLLAACSEHGQTPPGVDASVPTPMETAMFAPLVCTGGNPGSPNCPFNHIPLVVGSEAQFTVQPLGSTILFPDLTFIAGQAGLVIVNPKVVIGDMAIGPLIEVDLAPGAAETVPSFSVLDVQLNGGMSLRFDSIDTQP